jgi:hypothetical protein
MRLPQGTKAMKLHLLVLDRAVAHEQADGFVKPVVPSVLDHEVVAYRFSVRQE